MRGAVHFNDHDSGRRSPRRLLFALLFALLPICSLNVRAQYRFDVWTTDNGLPQNSVYSILQTRDGYLWLATLDGLVRYNGAQFTVFNHANTRELTSQRLKTLSEDSQGNLWISSEEGPLMRHRDGSFLTFTTKHGLPENRVD
ncbi:MAG TPA: two-component regulator propeller domain-containing protein, partial [Blastocatellia bacterium]